LDEVEDGNYEVSFGNDVLGKALTNGNLVICEYMATNGPDPNGGGSLTTDWSDIPFSGSISSVVSPIGGGAIPETNDDIKYSAPKSYQAQNRAVTARDYETAILTNFGSIEAATVYGGETLNPPAFGKVFISLKPQTGGVITDTIKDSIKDSVLESRNIVTVIPEFVDPIYLYVKVTTEVRYDETKTTKSRETIKSEVLSTIASYGDNELEKFNKEFRHSVLSTNIDNTDTSITGNLTNLMLQKRFTPTIGVAETHILNFDNPIFHRLNHDDPEIQSSSFQYEDNNGAVVTAFIDDDGFANSSGIAKLRIYKIVDGVKQYITTDAGTVEYATGQVILNSFKAEEGTAEISITATPSKNDFKPIGNTIITIDSSDISVTALREGDPGVGVSSNGGSASSSTTSTGSGL
jgi:hypothetical protein